jgi:hypothetical protein
LLEVSTPFTADFDGDGDVDGDDLTDPVDGWETRYGNDLDGINFLEWQRQFGNGVGGLAASTTVPEPSSLILAALGLLTLSKRWRAGSARKELRIQHAVVCKL